MFMSTPPRNVHPILNRFRVSYKRAREWTGPLTLLIFPTHRVLIELVMTASYSKEGPRPRPAVLCILDGWGARANGSDNAIARARTPHYSRMLSECPHALLATSGRAVGLPDGQMGNSEVGHTNIGAGRLVMQDLPRIDDAVANGDLATRPTLVALIKAVKAAGGTVHLMGLLSPGGVHSHQAHIAALARALHGENLAVRIHAFLDGRDTPPESALGYVGDFETRIADLRNVRIATVSGRY